MCQQVEVAGRILRLSGRNVQPGTRNARVAGLADATNESKGSISGILHRIAFGRKLHPDRTAAPACRARVAVIRVGFMKRLLVCPLVVSALFHVVSAAEEKAAAPIVAVYDLEGVVSESGQTESSMFDLTMDASRPLTMLDVTRSLAKAATDAGVKAVVVDADGAELDFSQIQEIRRQLAALRGAGKDVWIYTEHLSNRMALLGSAANHFTLMPEADCSFHGIHAES